jgi:16S rRNA (adenine1518-N6/adenine1519-N6)-dimethyltransferase
VAALQAEQGDTVLEIGPGQGALTRHLVGAVQRLILVELDDDLAAQLSAEFGGRQDVAVVHEDFMQVDLRNLVDDVSRLIVVGNIPYNITTPIIFRLLERPSRPRRVVLMIQKEVADRIVAPPGDGAYGALSVGVRTVATVERLFTVGRNAFRPVPRVDSAVIRIEPLVPPLLEPGEELDVRELTRTLFSWRRKQLQKSLRTAPAYALDAAAVEEVAREAGIAADVRPEQLDPAQFVALARALRRLGRPRAGEEDA